MLSNKLLVLDVEGTLITGYDFNSVEPYPAIIAQDIKEELKKFKEAGFYIVLATGTDNANLEYYKREFTKAGIDEFISAYSPNNHDSKDGKKDKLNKYKAQFNITNNENIYFYDDGLGNVQSAKEAGFQNSYVVDTTNPLVTQLKKLSNKLKEMSDNFQKAKEELLQKNKKLTTHFLASPHTKSKKEVWKHFKNFIKDTTYTLTLMNNDDRPGILLEWVRVYKEQHEGINPFTILNEQRRSGIFSFLNPTETDSLKNFRSFLKGFTIPHELETLLVEKTDPKSKVTATEASLLLP